jgi:hypothetical protein
MTDDRGDIGVMQLINALDASCETIATPRIRRSS